MSGHKGQLGFLSWNLDAAHCLPAATAMLVEMLCLTSAPETMRSRHAACCLPCPATPNARSGAEMKRLEKPQCRSAGSWQSGNMGQKGPLLTAKSLLGPFLPQKNLIGPD